MVQDKILQNLEFEFIKLNIFSKLNLMNIIFNVGENA